MLRVPESKRTLGGVGARVRGADLLGVMMTSKRCYDSKLSESDSRSGSIDGIGSTTTFSSKYSKQFLPVLSMENVCWSLEITAINHFGQWSWFYKKAEHPIPDPYQGWRVGIRTPLMTTEVDRQAPFVLQTLTRDFCATPFVLLLRKREREEGEGAVQISRTRPTVSVMFAVFPHTFCQYVWHRSQIKFWPTQISPKRTLELSFSKSTGM